MINMKKQHSEDRIQRNFKMTTFPNYLTDKKNLTIGSTLSILLFLIASGNADVLGFAQQSDLDEIEVELDEHMKSQDIKDGKIIAKLNNIEKILCSSSNFDCTLFLEK